jgi:multidrug resistance efflux pump
MNIDIELLRARNDARRRGGGERPPSAVDVEELLRALDDAQTELRQLKADRADLMASAELWADLYSATVDRANAAEAVLRRLAEVPGDVQRYYALLDSVVVLREALESLVHDCTECAESHVGGILERAQDGWCGRCAKAVDALRTTLEWRS